jgi:hypothetical protein
VFIEDVGRFRFIAVGFLLVRMFTNLRFPFSTDDYSALPHGKCYTVMGQILAILGLYMTYEVMTGCFFQRITLVNPLNGEPIAGSERGYGFLSREADFGTQPDYKQCIYYPDEEYADLFADGWMPAAKLFVQMSGILGIIGACVLILACCLAYTSVMFERWLLWGYLLAAAFSALSMLIFGSQFCADNECEIGQTGGSAISLFLFWCVMANTVKSMGEVLPPKKPRGQEDDDDDDDYGYDDGYVGNDDDDETGQDMYFETPEAMYVKRRPPPRPPQGSVSEDESSDDNNESSDDNESSDASSEDQPVVYDNTPRVGDSNGPIIT